MIFAASQDSTGLAVLSMLAIVVGFVVIAILFYGMVYKPSKDEKAQRAQDEERER